MNSDERLNRLVSYSFFGYQNTDLADLLDHKHNDTSPFLNLRNNQNLASEEVEACYLGTLTGYESSYLMYAFKFQGKEYGFAWEAYYDETHRAFDLDDEPPWYNFIEQGQMFKIKIAKDDPYIHYITEKPFSNMNGIVIKLGPCRDVINDENQ